MSTTISTAGVILKDVNGNVGKVNGLTDNDVATVNSAISAINKIAPSGSLPDATADTKGVVYAATKGVSVVQPESGKTYALTTESTDQLVTIANAQTITGEKTFSDVTTFKGNVNASSLYVRTTTDGSSNTPFYCISYNTTTDTGTTTNGLVYGDENTTINFGFSKEVTVPTVDASTSNTKAASTAFVHNAIKVDTTHAQITGDNTFSGNQNITGNVSITGNLSSTGTVTSGGSTVVTESTFGKQLSGKVIKTNPARSENQTIMAYSSKNMALAVGLGAVDMANATSVTVPTIADLSSSNTNAASTAFVQRLVSSKSSTETLVGYAHRKIVRGYDLISTGRFGAVADIAAAVRDGDFSELYIGDYFSVKDTDGSRHTLYIADIAPEYMERYEKPHLVLVGCTHSVAMNDTNSTAGGVASSTMWTSVFPALEATMFSSETAPLYGMVRTDLAASVSSAVSTTLTNPCFPNTTGVATGSKVFYNRCMLMLSDYNVFGAPILSTSAYDSTISLLPYHFPLFAIPSAMPTYIIGNSDCWLCNVCSSTQFGACIIGNYGLSNWPHNASEKIRALYAVIFNGKTSS